VLRDRRSEREVFDRLLADVRAGEGRALVVRGEPGVGKTALLEYVAERATGCRVERITGVQSEMELAFAGLHQLCVPLLSRVERLSGHQRDALSGSAIPWCARRSTRRPHLRIGGACTRRWRR
jgi:predicted ATPase